MTIASNRELTNARGKLRLLEDEYRDARADTSEDPLVRELSMQSLKRLINELKEEIARYRVHQTAEGRTA